MLITVDFAAVDGNRNPDFGVFKTMCAAAGSTAAIAIFRGAWGVVPDSTVKTAWIAAQRAGLICGAYLFLRMTPQFSPEDQVHVMADNVGTLRAGDLVPTIDVEDTGLSAEAELDYVHRAWTALKDIYGVPPMIYTSSRVWTENLHNLAAGEMIDSPLWVAKPWPDPVHAAPRLSGAAFAAGTLDPVVPQPWGAHNWWLHQYQGDAVKVFSNTVDLSRFNLMRQGETGARVSWVQRRISSPMTKLTPGVFDAAMLRSVQAFQALHGLVADGVIGPKTFVAICWSPGEAPLPAAA